MTEKEMRKLSREDLLQLLLTQRRENEKITSEIEILRKQLEDREIKLGSAGSIAEAALQVNGFFEAAQASAAQYLENIKQLEDRQKEACERAEAEGRAKVEKMIAETEKKCAQMEEDAQKKYREIMNCAGTQLTDVFEAARANAKKYLDEIEMLGMKHNISNKPEPNGK